MRNKGGRPKKEASKIAAETVIEEPAMPEVAPEIEHDEDDVPVTVAPEDVAPATLEFMHGLEDKSGLNDRDKMQCLINILKILPPQYRSTEEETKQNVWNIGRFEPTNAMITAAFEAIEDEPKKHS